MRTPGISLATLAALSLGLSLAATAQAPAPASPPAVAGQPNYLTSPYHGMRDGDGRIIPCRCRFDGRDYRLGEIVCMSTHLGTVMTRCDIELNNTSWIPTSTPCEVSRLPDPAPRTLASRRD